MTASASPPLRAVIAVALQWLLPTRLLSVLVHRLAEIRVPWFKALLIRAFRARFTIDLGEAAEPDAAAYPHFNAFFTRALRAGVRPQPEDPALITSPVDGAVSECGAIVDGQLLQAKGHRYSVQELLGLPAASFADGRFCTIYLAPHNYHRVHAPMRLQLRGWQHIPGRLFSVNPTTVAGRPRLFARNERVTALFDSDRGPLAMVFVGALLVGSIETVWAGRITPPHHRRPGQWQVASADYARGDEIGRFNMGSTVILVAAPGVLEWNPELTAGQPLRLGQPIGQPGPQ